MIVAFMPFRGCLIEKGIQGSIGGVGIIQLTEFMVGVIKSYGLFLGCFHQIAGTRAELQLVKGVGGRTW